MLNCCAESFHAEVAPRIWSKCLNGAANAEASLRDSEFRLPLAD
jgi:hypothetical protein